MPHDEHPSVTNFREYLRCKSVHPDPDYHSSVMFLEKMAKELGLPCDIINVTLTNPVVVITWKGEDPSLPSIMLNSHIDVVPVFPEHWSCDPFEAVKRENGDIVARGSQDMKCVGMQYIEAIRRLKNDGKRFLRTIYMTFVPDEELGGENGMQLFVNHGYFKSMNVGFSLDEGIASPTDVFSVFYSEKASWWLTVTARGSPGHGSRFIENTAAEKIQKVINSFMALRAAEKEKLESDPKLTIGDVLSLNMTVISGGVQLNVVPSEMSVSFDMRVPPRHNFTDLEKRIEKMVSDAGSDIEMKWLQKGNIKVITRTDDNYPWWKAFIEPFNKIGIRFDKQVFMAGTDSTFLREVGIPALGFSPMNNTPILLHDHDEFLNEKVFLKGIDIYFMIIPSLASVPKF